MIGSLLLFALQLVVPQENTARADDIVVTAVRDTCTLRFADKTMTDAEFDARAAEWRAGRPVRVISRADADLPCVRRIASKLFGRGVTRIEFVDPTGKPSFPFDPPVGLPRYPAPSGVAGDVSRAAAKLIVQGKCAEARKMALEQGDLYAAAAVAAVCRAPGQ
jgi:hypothetical protein